MTQKELNEILEKHSNSISLLPTRLRRQGFYRSEKRDREIREQLSPRR